MIFTMNKPEFHLLLWPLTPRPQIMKSDVQKYNKCLSVCKQHVNASLQFRYFRQSTQQGRQETYDFSQHFKDMIGFFTTLHVHAFGAGKSMTKTCILFDTIFYTGFTTGFISLANLTISTLWQAWWIILRQFDLYNYYKVKESLS